MAEQKKFMDVKEFRELGILQELNRRFLHPLGLAIEVKLKPDGSEELGKIWDCREDPEGIIFADDIVSDPEFKVKAEYVYEEMARRGRERIHRLGFNEQPHISAERVPKLYRPVFSGRTEDEGAKITIYKHVDREDELYLELEDGVLHALPPGTEVYTRFDMEFSRFHVQINSPVWTGKASGERWELLDSEAR